MGSSSAACATQGARTLNGNADALQLLTTALQLLIGATFLVAAIPKMLHPGRFAETVAEYELVPVRLERGAAGVVIVGELLVAASFLAGLVPAAGIALALALLGAFGFGTAINLRRGREIDCGCFGGAKETISSRSLTRIALLAGGVIAYALAVSVGTAEVLAPSADSRWRSLSTMAAAAAIAGGTAIAAAWVLESRRLLDILREESRA